MPSDDNTNGGWREWSQYVKLSIGELKAQISNLQTELINIKVELGMLRMKVTMWGAIGATVASVLLQVLFAYLKLKGGP